MAWWLLIIPALCFPAVRSVDLTLLTMNWTCLIYGGAMFLALTYYAISARRWFRGPKINVRHIQGVEPDVKRQASTAMNSEKHDSG